MEGYWFEGRWMPGPLYFFVNLCKIELNKDSFSTTKITMRPTLRDIEWEKAYVFMEARGFSGFKDDSVTTCYEGANTEGKSAEDMEVDLKMAPPEALINGKFKKYMSARKYLRREHLMDLGKPLFQNQAWNVIDMEARGGGKSYNMANAIVLHTFLMDGMYDYDEYRLNIENETPSKAEVLVGAIDKKYTAGLLDKVSLSIENMEGRQTIQGVIHRSPLYKNTTGSWNSGKGTVVNLYEEKIGNEWVIKGSGSKIHNRSFADNPFAANGTRPAVSIIDEVGFFNILEEALGAMKDITYNGAMKFGTIYMAGTGGENDAQSVSQVKNVFNNPAQYDCLSFDNIWEESASIGMFVPYQMTLNDFKNEEGVTDIALADKFVERKRAKLNQGRSKRALYDEMMNNPTKPSEIFLSKNANIFPVADLKDHLDYLKANQTNPDLVGQNGTFGLEVDASGNAKVKWKPDLTNSMKPCFYPMGKSDDTTGCWVIWEHPSEIDGEIPHGLYISGTDPYDQDKAPNSVSLGSTFIYKTYIGPDETHDVIVAEYTARPATANEHHEQVRRGLLYYNARNLYENERNTMKMHFEHKNSLYLLTKTPTMLKASSNSNVQRGYGTHMTVGIKDEIEIYARDHLIGVRDKDSLNLHGIKSIPLLEELIAYNREGNFDRVIAFMLVVVHKLMNYRVKVEAIKTKALLDDPFFKRFAEGKFYK